MLQLQKHVILNIFLFDYDEGVLVFVCEEPFICLKLHVKNIFLAK